MIIGKSAARSSRRNVGDRPKTMCRQKLRTEGPAAGHPLYLAFLIGRTKSTLNSAILRFSAHDHFLSLCTDAGRVRPSTRTLFAFSRRGPCIPSAFGTWPPHALHQVHKQGCPSNLALSSRGTEAGKR